MGEDGDCRRVERIGAEVGQAGQTLLDLLLGCCRRRGAAVVAIVAAADQATDEEAGGQESLRIPDSLMARR